MCMYMHMYMLCMYCNIEASLPTVHRMNHVVLVLPAIPSASRSDIEVTRGTLM